jgi:outer membrane receptor protein involved in Fe transport
MGRKARNGARAAIEPGIIAAARGRTATWLRLAVLALTFLSPSGAGAQSATGDIYGVVVDQLGGPLVGVSVVVTNTGTGVARRTTTNGKGLFSVTGLAPGSYEVAGSLEGFAAGRQEGIRLLVGQAVASRIELRRALLDETLTLTPAPPALEPLRTEASDTIAPAEIDFLPLAGRDVLDLVALAPGVTRAATSAGNSVAGLPAAMNVLVVDGAETRDDSADSTLDRHAPYTFGRAGVESLRVTSFAAPAEYASAGGAVVSVATPSGSNRLQGELFELFQDSALRGNSPEHTSLGLPKPPSRSNQFGASVGGPIARNRHFFFASYDGLRERDEQIVFLNPPEALPPDPLTSAAIGQLTPLASGWPRARDQDLLLVRTDHQLADGHQLRLRYDSRSLTGSNIEARGPQTSIDVTGPATARSQSIGATIGSAFSKMFFNDLRARYERDRDLGWSNGDRPQANVHEGGALVLRVGGNALAPRDTRSTRFHVADTLMWAQGPHAFKIGGDMRLNQVNHVFSEHLAGEYSFRTLAGFATGVPSASGDRYTQTFLREGLDRLVVHPDSDDYAAFVQDTWQLTDTVTLDLGVRYDLQRLAAPPGQSQEALGAGLGGASIPVDRDNWGPRLGLAWAPSSRYVVRAAYAVVYGRTPATLAAAAHAYNGIDVRVATLDGGSGPAPAYPGRLAAIPSSARPTVVGFDRRFENPRVEQASAGVDWEWMPNTVLSLSFLHTRGDDLPRGREVNVGELTPVTLTVADDDERFEYPRFGPGPLATFDRIILLESVGTSSYNAATIEMRRRLAQGFQYRISYTLGKAIESAPLATIVLPESVFDRAVHPDGIERSTSRVVSDNDQRHRILTSFVIFTDGFAERRPAPLKSILDDWRIGAIYTIVGGRPFSAFVDVDLDGDGNAFNDIAPGTTRNGFRTKREGRLDARLARDFDLPGHLQLTASLDVFNLTNATHYRATDNTLYTAVGTTLFRNPQFGERTDVREPRVLQLGVTLGF